MAWTAAHREHQLQLQLRAEESWRSQEARTERAVIQERARIARELHDVVAHHVSVMGVQAGACRRVMERDPAKARTALTAVEHAARRAVDELRRMLGVLARRTGPRPSMPRVTTSTTWRTCSRPRATPASTCVPMFMERP